MKSMILRVSSSFTPLVVIAGSQILSHDGRNGGLGSSGMVDLDVEIQILSRVFSATDPSNHVPVKSTITI